MDLNARLRRVESRAAELMPDGTRCPRCEAPIPSIPIIVLLGSDGSIHAGSVLDPTPPPCPECGGYGRRTALRYDPETGRPRGILILLPADEEAERLDLGLEGWLARHDGRELGPPWDAWICALRRTQGGSEASTVI